MSIPEALNLFPDSPALSLIVWLVAGMVLLYLARVPAHQVIRSTARVISNALRTAARTVAIAEANLSKRNREVIISSGIHDAERAIAREFHRIDAVVRKDLGAYPALNRSLSDLVARIDEDYSRCTEVPPAPSSWLNAIEAVAKIKTPGDSAVAKVLGDIKATISAQHKDSMEEYRNATSERHAILGKIAPYWREAAKTMERVEKTVTGVFERSKAVDRKIDAFEKILKDPDNAAKALVTSSLTQFLIAGLVLLIAIGGAVINFNLIALPMSEMVGGGSYIGPYKTSNVAALVIIMVETAIGLYLMESLRITNLFPVIGSMNDKMRVRMIWITFGILLILAGIEASLAYMRDQIAADMHTLRQALSEVEAAPPVNTWIPTAGQMIMGFILPFALTFVAIPLESFMHSSRTVVGIIAAWALRFIAFALRLLGGIVRGLGSLTVSLYDLAVFPGIWVERLVRERAPHPAVTTPKEGA